jgi:Domain of unknown function (DUF4129)
VAGEDADENPSRRRPGPIAVGSVLVVLLLMAVVAIAATGSTSNGTGRSAAPGNTLFDTVVSLLIVAVFAGFAIALYFLLQGKNLEWSTPKRRYGITSLAAFLLFAFGIIVYARIHGLTVPFDPQQAPLDRTENTLPPPRFVSAPDSGYDFHFAWLPVLVVGVLAVAAVAAFVLSVRRRKPRLREPLLAQELATAIDVSLDDLRAEADARRAVIAAYARLERVLAAHGQPRRPADTPEEHVSRALSTLDVDRRVVRRLEELYLQAKFSQHTIDRDMKDAAIAALERVRDDLRSSGRDDPLVVGMPA